MSVVLTVDDAEVELAIYERLLRAVAWPDGIENVGFLNSAEALEWAASHDIDLAIADYTMQAPNGLEFIERIRATQRHRETPIIMITATMEHEVRYRALDLGANDFLTKPIDRIEFVVRVRNMLVASDAKKKLAGRGSFVPRERETIHRLTRAAEIGRGIPGMHVVRMGFFCAVLADALGIPAALSEMLSMAAPMHDIGKVATPSSILLKPGPLTPGEWELVKQHTIRGNDILGESDSEVLQLAAEIAVSHHERFDGSGYPHALAGEAIPIGGRICAVSDAFDALTSKRPYGDPWPVDRAVGHIATRAGSHFDPRVVAALHAVLPEMLEVRKRYADDGVVTVR
jgi:putative two-component system response regulator